MNPSLIHCSYGEGYSSRCTITSSFITLPNGSMLIYVHSVECFHHIIYSSLLGPQSRARAFLVIFTYPLTHVVYYSHVEF